MKKILSIGMIAAALLMVAGLAFGGDDFWKSLKGKMQNVTPKKKTTVVTAVGGVRGAAEDANDSLYWKGKESQAQVPEEELDMFNGALDLAVEGKNAEAIKTFEAFLAKYPDSSLKKDASDALANLKSAPAAAKPAETPAAAPAPAAEPQKK